MQTVHLFGNMNQDDADKDIRSDEIRSAKNLVSQKQGKGLRRVKVRGNESIVNDALNDFVTDFLKYSDQNDIDDFYNSLDVIGSYENTSNSNTYIFYRLNNLDPTLNGFILIEVTENSSNLLLTPANLPFSKLPSTDYIIDINVVDEYLHFCIKGQGQFFINIERARNGAYEEYSCEELLLQKKAPLFAPVVSKSFVESFHQFPTADRKLLENKVIKFAYRYTYEDDSKSTFSPLSDAQVGTSAPDYLFQDVDDYKAQTPLYYIISIDNEVPLNNTIKNIEFAVVDNLNQYSIFKNITANEFNIADLFVVYLGNEGLQPLSEEEAIRIEESNPITPTSSVAYEDRIIQTGGSVGRNDSDFDNISLSATYTLINDKDETNIVNLKTPYFRYGGLYDYAVQFYDKDGKRSLAQNKKTIQLEYENNSPLRAKINVTTGGNPPSWATHFQLLSNSVKNYTTYIFCKAFVFYSFADRVKDDFVISSNLFRWGESVYLDNFSNIDATSYNYVHLVIPDNLPFQVDTSYKVKFSYTPVGKSESIIVVKNVLDVIDGRLVLSPFEENLLDNDVEVEIFSEINEFEDIIYENGDVIDISEWGGTFELKGDTYYINSDLISEDITWLFPRVNVQGDGTNLETLIDGTKDSGTFKEQGSIKTISQTPSIVRSGLREAEITREYTRKISPLYFGFLNIFKRTRKIKIGIDQTVNTTNLFTLDFSKEINSNGRINVEDKNSIRLALPNTVYYSKKKIQDTRVNGLSSFNFNDNYTLPSERGPIVQLVPVSNVILALHPRNTTSLYIGEGFIRQGNDAILAKTEGVIGDDRLLQGNYGTIHPESIQVYKGNAFFWDQYSSELVRYNDNGLTPLGKVYKMKTFFDKWGELLKGSTLPVLGGFDPFYEMYVLKFPAIGEQASETIGFRNKDRNEGFVTLLDYDGADYFATSGEELISVNRNNIYKHNGTNVTLYGNAVETEIDFIHNEQPTTTKVYESAAINADKAVTLQVSNHRGQYSDLLPQDFRLVEDTYYADILRDVNTPADQLPAGAIALRDGRLMKSQFANIKLKGADVYDEVVISTLPATGQYLNR